jgi:thiol-disulfide isomerase/thioredoxin
MDTGFLSQASISGTNSVEQGLLDRFQMASKATPENDRLTDEGPMPSIDGAVTWINSPPLDRQALKGKVVLVDFWTYSCINCLRALPYVKAWADKYRADGLVVIGVHAPEFAFEKDVGNVRKAVQDLGIDYPVAVDNDYAIWRAFHNRYWPAHYFIDAKGRLRHHHFGEGDYAGSERLIQQLLAEAHPGLHFDGTVTDTGKGAEAAASGTSQSPETYIGYAKATHFVTSPAPVHEQPATYDAKPSALNQWGLTGTWTVKGEQATLDKPGGRIIYRFHARDLHLVLGPGATGKPIRYRVTIDGKAPGDDHGIDTDAAGNGMVDGQRLYQLVRLRDAKADHDFAIEFLDPGVQAFSFTFG